MPKRIIRSILTYFVLALASATMVFAQSSTSSETSPEAPVITRNTWRAAQMIKSKGKLFVVTIDQPDRKRACRIQSFTLDKLVCSRTVGGSRTYLPKQVVALILPGDDHLQLKLFLGFNAGLGAAIWGTVVLAATCPPCAVGTGIAALLFFDLAGLSAFADSESNRLLYLAPGQQLSKKLGFVES